MWVSAASQTSRAKVVRSDAQSRNADLNPCTGASDSSRRMIMSNTMLDIGFPPERPGKTNSLPAARILACLSSSMQHGASGTRCSLPAFIRPAGIVQAAGLEHLAGPRRRQDQQLKGQIRDGRG